ncbi:corticotropin-releasing factor-binding protein-like isoform X2 [Xiphias gladius]|uniref:corticotropin-releasing factor-binding protein-like isoform X2 n=1 Tax=Xiphias gladius TaxID=8245 RepID=UPI001A9893A9|nr:corticotropin-releasing factor-binding protein-like isoform X2 [Xiphias gladius]
MSPALRAQLFLLLISLSSRMGLSRHIEDNEASDGLYSLLSLDQKRESEDFIFRRPLRCLDMLATDGYFTFVASGPQLACAAFIIAEPSEVIGLELSEVSIDCSAGDFIKMFDGWVLKGEKFPSSQDHQLPLHQRYTDYCSFPAPGSTSRSSQNVAMIFFRIHSPDSGFTLAVKKLHNPFPCNIMSQSPEGSFTMVMPHQRRNCSFSIIYPVDIQLTELSLGQAKSNELSPQRQVWSGCSGSGDYVELLGGNGVDTSKMFPVADLCFSLSGLVPTIGTHRAPQDPREQSGSLLHCGMRSHTHTHTQPSISL